MSSGIGPVCSEAGQCFVSRNLNTVADDSVHCNENYLLLNRTDVSMLPQRDAVLSEPAIQVRRKGKGKQIWALEKLENRLVDMRELYQEWKDFDEDNPVSTEMVSHKNMN